MSNIKKKSCSKLLLKCAMSSQCQSDCYCQNSLDSTNLCLKMCLEFVLSGVFLSLDNGLWEIHQLKRIPSLALPACQPWWMWENWKKKKPGKFRRRRKEEDEEEKKKKRRKMPRRSSGEEAWKKKKKRWRKEEQEEEEGEEEEEVASGGEEEDEEEAEEEAFKYSRRRIN